MSRDVDEPGAQRCNVGVLLGYVEYVGDDAGSYTPDIPTLGELLGYVEYIDEPGSQCNIGELLGYVEYISEPGDQRRTIGELIGYVEYVGNAAGSYTPDIPTLGELLAYVEYTWDGHAEEPLIPPVVLVYGPLVWMM